NDPTQGMRLRVQSAAGQVTALGSFGGYAVIFTAAGGYLLQGTDPTNYNLQKFTDHGCVSHRTLRPMRDRLMWLGEDGVYQATYQFPRFVVERVSQDEWETFY